MQPYFEVEIDRWRTAAQDYWHQLRFNREDCVSPTIPGHLLDRIAFRMYASSTEMLPINDGFALGAVRSKDDWIERTKKALVGVPRLGIAPLDLSAGMPKTGLVLDLIHSWHHFLSSIGVACESEKFFSALSGTWQEFFLSSPTSPFFTPAIAGPTFANRIPFGQLRTLVSRYGGDGSIWDFYAFLVISHEITHSIQRGDPLLCEFVLGYVWCKFLSRSDLWIFQSNSVTGEVFNVEFPYVSTVDFRGDDLAAIMQDTANITRLDTSPGTYSRLCHLTYQFDAKNLRYREYLGQVKEIFSDQNFFI